MIRSAVALCLLLLPESSLAFVAPRAGYTTRTNVLTQSTSDDINEPIRSIRDDDEEGTMNRRSFFVGSGLAAASALLLPNVALAEDSSIGSSKDHPIVVLGAGGKVGKLCTQILADSGKYVSATTRSGRDVFDGSSASPYVTFASADVTKLDSLEAALKGASGVIFAASASGKKKGGDPAHVDYLGVYNTAKACLAAGVPKLAVVSAGTVSRPDSAGFKATNFFVKYVYGEKVMDYKIAGESAMRDLYAGQSACGYTVVRPGGLNDKPSVGSSKVHVSQGDVYSSEISRTDVALVTVAALLKGKATDGTTFELNQVEGVGKAMDSLPTPPTELVHAGASTFDGLLDGLLTDAQLKSKYGDLINDSFKGSGIEPVTSLV